MPEAHQPSIRTEFPKQLSPLGGEGGCCCLAMGQGSSSQVSLLLLLLQESEKLKSNLKKICLYTDRIPDFSYHLIARLIYIFHFLFICFQGHGGIQISTLFLCVVEPWFDKTRKETAHCSAVHPNEDSSNLVLHDKHEN